jgi:S1-C subfamily serine protease
MEKAMLKGLSTNRIRRGLAIIAAFPIGTAIAAGVISANGPSAQDLAALFGSAESHKSHEVRPYQVEEGSVADAVEAAKPAVFSVRAKHRAAVDEPGAGVPLDQFADQRSRSFLEAPFVRTSQGSGFFISAVATPSLTSTS